jgi:hypothetical protein
MKRLLLILCLIGFSAIRVLAQKEEEETTVSADMMMSDLAKKKDILLLDMNVQIEATNAINKMYNFQFEQAEKEFEWLKYKYPEHPLPYFLLGLSEWWKIVPNVENEQYDERFMAYMDSSIMKAEALHKANEDNIEASFFLAAAHGFKGRLLSERKSWTRAALEGKASLDYLQETQRDEDFGPEFLFGDALYNYYSIWVPENYPMLKPIIMFFRKGDKQKGIEQLREVASNAFYTRTEAQFFLMRILAGEGESKEAFNLAQYLHQTFPDNPYFHRYYARMLYTRGQYRQLEPVAKDIIAKIDSSKFGYEEVSGRYAAFYLGQIFGARKDMEQSKYYYERAVEFCEAIEEDEAGYYLWSLVYLGRIAEEQGDEKEAKKYYRRAKRKADRGDAAWKQAKQELKEL